MLDNENCCDVTSLLHDSTLSDHDLGDEIDNGGGRLVRIELCKHVTLVVDRTCTRLSRHEPKQPKIDMTS